MKPKSEELLNLLLWSADMLLRPTFRNLTDSYESWAYRNGLLRQIGILEKQQLVERDPAWRNERIYRLTKHGRLHTLGGRDPIERWSRKWDGRWRLVLFDVPTTQNTRRTQLRRYLRKRGFGYLQNSVWITPDALEEERQILVGGKVNQVARGLAMARNCRAGFGGSGSVRPTSFQVQFDTSRCILVLWPQTARETVNDHA